MSSGAPTREVVPDGAQHITARDQATQYLVQHGNLYVGGPPNYRVDEFRALRGEVPPSRFPRRDDREADWGAHYWRLTGAQVP